MPARKLNFLEQSQLQISQQEMLAQDLDVDSFKILIQNGFAVPVNIVDRITSMTLSRTIQGASTLTVGIIDDKLEFWRSGAIRAKVDVQLDGLWWRLTAIDKSGFNVTLTFEDRTVAVLRTYTGRKIVARGQGMTRAQFILGMLQEVTEFVIPYYIPDLDTPEPVYNPTGVVVQPSPLERRAGLSSAEKLTVKGAPITPIQAANARAIMNVADQLIPKSNVHRVKIKIVMMMTAITESRILDDLLQTDPHALNYDSFGIFQQLSKYYPYPNDIEGQAREFLTRAINVDSIYPNLSYNDLAQTVQKSAFGHAYATWQDEATAIVNASGTTGGDGEQPAASYNAQAAYQQADTGYYFYRGTPPSRKKEGWQPESTWHCIQRLAQEVNWRAFFVGQTFYYLDDDTLFKSQPRAVLSEDSVGVNTIDGNYDTNKKTATVSISCRMGRYAIPPGAVVKIENQGVHNGRWIVDTISRDCFSPEGTIECDKPQPILLEPPKNNLSKNLLPQSQGNSFGGDQQNGKTNVSGPPLKSGSSIDLADKIVGYYNKGQYRDDHPPSEMNQWRKVADGRMLTNAGGQQVKLDVRVAQVIVYLLDNGWYIGTFALCEDHSWNVDGTTRESAHGAGAAVDISSIGRDRFRSINGSGSLPVDLIILKQAVITCMDLLRDQFNPNQIICNGVGEQLMPDVQSHQWNNGKQVNYITTDHTNHIHVGF